MSCCCVVLPLENKTTIKVWVFGDIYRMKYMAKTTDMFGSMKFWFKPKLTYAAGRESMIELLELVSDFMVNSRLKNI